VCVRACVRACVHACVGVVCVHACIQACMYSYTVCISEYVITTLHSGRLKGCKKSFLHI